MDIVALGVFHGRRKQPLFFKAALLSSGWVVRLYCPAMILNWILGAMPPGGHLGILWTTTMLSTVLLLRLAAFIFSFLYDRFFVMNL
jgi:hypothetical protein